MMKENVERKPIQKKTDTSNPQQHGRLGAGNGNATIQRMSINPNTLSPKDAQYLQMTKGNRAVAQFMKGIKREVEPRDYKELVQMQTGAGAPMQFVETLKDRIKRILAMRKIFIGNDEAIHYAALLTSNPENTEIQVIGRHRALKLNRIGVVSSVKRRPPSSAACMRISPEFGPTTKRKAVWLPKVLGRWLGQ